MWDLKDKQMNITKQKYARRYREQTGGDQWEEGQDKGRGLRGISYHV